MARTTFFASFFVLVFKSSKTMKLLTVTHFQVFFLCPGGPKGTQKAGQRTDLLGPCFVLESSGVQGAPRRCPREPKRGPGGPKRSPRDAKGEPKRVQGDPKGVQGKPRGPQKGFKGSPRGVPGTVAGRPKASGSAAPCRKHGAGRIEPSPQPSKVGF